MRNRHSQKLISSLLTATVAGLLALSIMPEIRCKTGDCVRSPGDICMDGDLMMIGYKYKSGYDG